MGVKILDTELIVTKSVGPNGQTVWTVGDVEYADLPDKTDQPPADAPVTVDRPPG